MDIVSRLCRLGKKVGMLLTLAHCTIEGPPKSNMSHRASTSYKDNVQSQAARE
jgi:hypothetical protein